MLPDLLLYSCTNEKYVIVVCAGSLKIEYADFSVKTNSLDPRMSNCVVTRVYILSKDPKCRLRYISKRIWKLL